MFMLWKCINVMLELIVRTLCDIHACEALVKLSLSYCVKGIFSPAKQSPAHMVAYRATWYFVEPLLFIKYINDIFKSIQSDIR